MYYLLLRTVLVFNGSLEQREPFSSTVLTALSLVLKSTIFFVSVGGTWLLRKQCNKGHRWVGHSVTLASWVHGAFFSYNNSCLIAIYVEKFYMPSCGESVASFFPFSVVQLLWLPSNMVSVKKYFFV